MAALTLWCLGFPAQAERRSQEALALAEVLAHPYSIAVAQFGAAALQHHRRAALAVQAQADALLTLAMAQGFPVLVGYGTCWRGWALAMQGQGEAGLRLLAEALVACKDSGRSDVLAEAYRLQGELFLRAGGRGVGIGSQSAVEAEACLHQALDTARRQQAKAWELRAALSLARLWQGQRQ
jgi:adenylate cyclase